MNVNLRRACTKDARHLMELLQANYQFDGIPFHAKTIRPALEKLLSDTSLGGAWFIEGEGNSAGLVVVTYGYDLELGGRVATINELYLRPEYRRKGLGNRALGLLGNILRQSGVYTLELQVVRTNTKAFNFYGKVGFRAHDRIPMSKHIDHAA